MKCYERIQLNSSDAEKQLIPFQVLYLTSRTSISVKAEKVYVLKRQQRQLNQIKLIKIGQDIHALHNAISHAHSTVDKIYSTKVNDVLFQSNATTLTYLIHWETGRWSIEHMFGIYIVIYLHVQNVLSDCSLPFNIVPSSTFVYAWKLIISLIIEVSKYRNEFYWVLFDGFILNQNSKYLCM